MHDCASWFKSCILQCKILNHPRLCRFLYLLEQVVVVIANILNGANLYGYIKCRVGGGKSIKDYATGIVSRQMFSAVSLSLSKVHQYVVQK